VGRGGEKKDYSQRVEVVEKPGTKEKGGDVIGALYPRIRRGSQEGTLEARKEKALIGKKRRKGLLGNLNSPPTTRRQGR